MRISLYQPIDMFETGSLPKQEDSIFPVNSSSEGLAIAPSTRQVE